MNEQETELKLWVWENVLADYTSGVMFTLAGTADEAREIIKRAHPESRIIERDLQEEPVCVAEPHAFVVWGGS